MQTHRHQADILIIGGGVCGLNAALTAREQGRSVIVMDKAVIERSGHIAGGIDHFLAYMDTGAEWDTREAYLEFTGKSARGVTNIDVVDSVYCQELPHALKRFEEINCTLRQPDGTYYRTKSYGQPGPWWINFNGKRMKPLLAKAARKAGCAVLDRVVTADLLTNGGTVCGAAGFDIRTGDFHIIRAGAVIISTGGTNRLYSNPSGMSFNTWMCPADTGDGEAMSLRAGAELANIVNEAALRAVRMGRKLVSQEDLEESVEVVIAGYQKKDSGVSVNERKIIAYHEVGHALVAACQSHSAPVHKITIIPRTSGALGYTMQVDEEQRYLLTKDEALNKIATFTGGRAAEELIFHSVTSGASNDIEQATRIARAMVTRYGMSETFDMVALETVTNQYLGGDTSLACAPDTAKLIDEEVIKIVREQHQKALQILKENEGKLHKIAEYLLEKETITGEEFMDIFSREDESL